MSKPNNKPRVTVADVSEQVQAMDRRLSELVHSTGNGDSQEHWATSALPAVSYPMVRARNANRRRSVKVVPLDDLARGMLLACAQTKGAITQAIARYLEAKRAVRRIRRLPIEPPEAGQVLIAYLSRWVGNGERDLAALGVTITPVEPGVPFNCKIHEVYRRQPAETEDQVDTIATAKTPLFSWKDAQGQDQICPAKVVVYCEPLGSL